MYKGSKKRREQKEDDKFSEEYEDYPIDIPLNDDPEEEIFYGSSEIVKDKTNTSGLISEAPTVPKSFEDKQKWQRLIVILEKATLHLTKTKRGTMELINWDDHQRTIKRMNKKYEDYRPDITHQWLLSLMDSPLNKAGKLQVLIRTDGGVLIEISPHMRIPRTYKRFAGLFSQLLSKLKIKAQGSQNVLMKVIKNKFDKILPINIRKIGTSSQAKLVDVQEYVDNLEEMDSKKPVVFVIGAVSTGNPGMEFEGIDDWVCISKYSLSAAWACSKISEHM